MLTCFDIADYFLAKSKADEDAMTNLKLQKLVYYAQGFHLAIYDKALFKQKILAWAHGPVIKVLYDEYSSFGANPIEIKDDVDFKKFDDRTIELLDDVYSIYGQYSAWKLRNLTHEEPPWKDTPRNQEISHDLMKKYFKTLLVNG